MNIATANRLLELRKMNGYSQDVLAEKIGVSRQAVSKWERAESSPDTDNLIALAELYGITLDDLLNTTKDVVEITPEPSKKDIKGKAKSLLSKVNDFGIYPKTAAAMAKFPYAIIIVILYVGLSYAFKIWHPLWLVFLTIPIYYRIATACKANSKKAFLMLLPVPEMTVLAYLMCGFFADAWGSMWILFLIIPIFYWVVSVFKGSPNEPKDPSQ
ncbi:MAG: helix-turn-helix transcriptional regulator [Eubacterium sp.]|nr:helix-turn-helix transcriptional regulator [Eubacterium sp.]